MTVLRRKLNEEIQLRGLSENTRLNYVHSVSELARFYGKSPDLLCEAQIREFMLSLHKRNLAPQTINLKISGLRFFYLNVLGQSIDEMAKAFQRPKLGRKLPRPYSPEAVSKILEACRKPLHRTREPAPRRGH